MEIITCDHSVCTMDHLDSIVCSFMESFIGLIRVINIANNPPSLLIQVTVLECYFIHYIRSLYNIAVAENELYDEMMPY